VVVWLAVGAVLLSLAGCAPEEGVSTYTLPKEGAAPGTGDKGPRRLLGAIIPRPNETWFVKLIGPDAAGAEQAEAFEKFVQTIRLDQGGKPITWTKPDDWEEKAGVAGREATFLVGPKKLELTVIRLGPLDREGPNTVLGNVNRWRGQAGLAPVADVAKGARKLDVAGVEVWLVNAGPAGPADDRQARGKGLQYKAPDGWKKVPNDQFSDLKFSVTDGGRKATVTFNDMDPQELLGNVNRWREQVGLAPVTEAQARESVRTLELEWGKASYVDVSGGGKRLLGVLVARGRRSWVFKMVGEAELIGRQKDAFEAFVKSVRLE
jgi:hypothetical protein